MLFAVLYTSDSGSLNYFILSLSFIRYWDTRQSNPVHTQQLPDRCHAMDVKYPLMVVATADKNIVIFNLQNPQVIVYAFL